MTPLRVGIELPLCDSCGERVDDEWLEAVAVHRRVDLMPESVHIAVGCSKECLAFWLVREKAE